MCEMFGMTARLPTNVRLSLDELAKHGGGTGPHQDGWGIAFYEENDALLIREAAPAVNSAWVGFLGTHQVQSALVVAHIRKATVGGRALCNTQPFVRELGGRAHVFSHNGKLAGIERDERFQPGRFRPIGDTDSEVAFCALLDRIERVSASLDDRLHVIAAFAAELRTLGPANFLYSDGNALFAHGHRRTQTDGAIRPPGLYFLCRTCSESANAPSIAGVSMSLVERQEVALLASVPLTNEPWCALAEGEVVVLREGRVVARCAALAADVAESESFARNALPSR